MTVSGKSLISKYLTTQEIHHFKKENLMQIGQNQSFLLQLPSDLMRLIGKYCATGNTLLEAAKNTVYFGRVCILTHLLTHVDEINAVISLSLAVEEVVDASINRRATGWDIGTTISDEDRVLWNEHVSSCKILYSIFKKTIDPVDSQNVTMFTERGLNVFSQIRLRCGLEKIGGKFNYREEQGILKKNCLVLQTFVREVVKSVLFVHAKNSFTKKNFQNKIHEMRETFKNAKNLFGYPIIDSASIKKIILSILDENYHAITSLMEIKAQAIKNEVMALENELNVLRGPNHFDGIINEFYHQKLSAQKNGEIENADRLGKLLDERISRLNQIALFDDSGKIVGGKLTELHSQLENIAEKIPEIRAMCEQQKIYEKMISFLD